MLALGVGMTTAMFSLVNGILLAPGEFFSLRAPQTAWFRFNVAYASEPLLLDFLLACLHAQPQEDRP